MNSYFRNNQLSPLNLLCSEHKLLLNKYKTIKYNYFTSFYFVHINKTAGTSIGRALSLPRKEHKTALEKIQEIGIKRWEKKYTFTFIRNPWDRVVSIYFYRLQKNMHGLRKEEPLPFKRWVELTFKERCRAYLGPLDMVQPQSYWISDKSGNILVNECFRFENLNNAFADLCAKIGKQNIYLSYLNKTNRLLNYRHYYDKQSKDIIQEFSHEDIERFSYRF